MRRPENHELVMGGDRESIILEGAKALRLAVNLEFQDEWSWDQR